MIKRLKRILIMFGISASYVRGDNLEKKIKGLRRIVNWLTHLAFILGITVLTATTVGWNLFPDIFWAKMGKWLLVFISCWLLIVIFSIDKSIFWKWRKLDWLYSIIGLIGFFLITIFLARVFVYVNSDIGYAGYFGYLLILNTVLLSVLIIGFDRQIKVWEEQLLGRNQEQEEKKKNWEDFAKLINQSHDSQKSDPQNELAHKLIDEFVYGFILNDRVEWPKDSIRVYLKYWVKHEGQSHRRAKSKKAAFKEENETPGDSIVKNWEKNWSEFLLSRTGKKEISAIFYKRTIP